MLLKDVIIADQFQGYCRANIFIENEIIQNIEIIEVDDIDFARSEFFVTPGFVNAHLHPNQLLDRRMLDDLSITELLHGMHTDYKKDDKMRYTQALLVLIEAVKCGATTIYSVASNPHPVIKAYNTCQVKGAVTCFYNDQWEGYGTPPALQVLNSIREQFESVFKHQNEKVRIHIGSASVESASNELLILMNELAKQYNTKVNIHISEGIEAVMTCLNSRGLTPVRLLNQLGVLSDAWNLVHAVNIDDEEIDLIAKAGTCVIHCPVTNAKTGVGIAPIIKLIEKGVRIGLGTDACSNNNTNNILNEAYFASLIHAAFQQNAKAITVETLMQWIMQQGHQIIGTQQKGVICEGEPADLLFWSLNQSAFVPLAYGKYNSALIYNAPDIKPYSVMIDGKKVVENYKFLPVSEDELIRQANFYGQRLHNHLKQPQNL